MEYAKDLYKASFAVMSRNEEEAYMIPRILLRLLQMYLQWAEKVNFVSKYTPKYLKVSTHSSKAPLKKISGRIFTGEGENIISLVLVTLGVSLFIER